MVTGNTNRRAGDAAARQVVRDWRDGPTRNSQTALTPQAAIRADLIGHDTCTALGVTVRGAAPVLALCRQLFEAGYGPATSVEAWRGSVLCLRVRSIAEGAKLAVVAAGNGTPVFAANVGAGGFRASAVRQNR
jgi:hypothetical protein